MRRDISIALAAAVSLLVGAPGFATTIDERSREQPLIWSAWQSRVGAPGAIIQLQTIDGDRLDSLDDELTKVILGVSSMKAADPMAYSVPSPTAEPPVLGLLGVGLMALGLARRSGSPQLGARPWQRSA